MNYRIEKDSMGEIKVESDKYWGAQTQRSLQNFNIGNEVFPREFIKAYGIIKYVAALVNNNNGLVSDDIKNVIQEASNDVIKGKYDDQFPLVVWQTGSGTQTNMNFNEVIANIANKKLGNKIGVDNEVHPNDHVNRSQSTNDTFPTAINIASAIQINSELLPALDNMLEKLNLKCDEFNEIVKIGRTHLQDATPLTLGQEFSGYSKQIENSIISIKNTLKFLYYLPMGGTAVGTGLNAPDSFDKDCAYEIAKITSLPFKTSPNKFESLACHDSVVEVSGSLKGLAISLNKIANDIRWLGSGPRAGIAEIVLPSNEPGSSIMPGKVNPTQCEAVTMVCSQIIGNDATLTFAGASGNFELNVFRPVMAYNILQSIRLLSDVVNSFTNNCIIDIKANEEKINNNVNKSLMLVTALTPHIGYDKAAEAAKKAHSENSTLKSAILSLGYLNGDEYDEYVDPKKMI